MESLYVTFNQAKLLKEKGFDEPCLAYWIGLEDLEPTIAAYNQRIIPASKLYKHRNTFLSIKGKDIVISNEEDWEGEVLNNPDKFDRKLWGVKVIAPEQWQVVEWLRVNHGIWVYADFLGSWKYVIVRLEDNSRRAIEGYKSSQEAYSSAFDYVLKKVI